MASKKPPVKVNRSPIEDKKVASLAWKLKKIQEKEPEFFDALEESINHLHATYEDKYEATKELLDTKVQMYDKERGEFITTYQISRYLQRFMAPKTFKKGGNKNDLFKIIHYALFSVVRKNRHGEDYNIEHKD